MAVKFQPFAQAGVGSDGTFLDTFQRANVSEGAGPNWALNRQQSTVNICLFSITTNKLRWTFSAGSGSCHNFLFALPGMAVFGSGSAGASPLQAQSHFSEHTIDSDNSVLGSLTRVGAAVAMQGTTNNGSCYIFENFPEVLSYKIQRNVNGSLTSLVDHSATPMYSTVVGLKVKLSVEFTNSTTTTVRCYLNDVLTDVLPDTNAARLTNGGPGIFGEFCSTGRSCNYSQYRCGPGI